MKYLTLIFLLFLIQLNLLLGQSRKPHNYSIPYHYEINNTSHYTIGVSRSKIGMGGEGFYFWGIRTINRTDRLPFPYYLGRYVICDDYLRFRDRSTCFGGLRDYIKIELRNTQDRDTVFFESRRDLQAIIIEKIPPSFSSSSLQFYALIFLDKNWTPLYSTEYMHGLGFLRIQDHIKDKDYRLTHINQLPIRDFLQRFEPKIQKSLDLLAKYDHSSYE